MTKETARKILMLLEERTETYDQWSQLKDMKRDAKAQGGSQDEVNALAIAQRDLSKRDAQIGEELTALGFSYGADGCKREELIALAAE